MGAVTLRVRYDCSRDTGMEQGELRKTTGVVVMELAQLEVRSRADRQGRGALTLGPLVGAVLSGV